MTVTDSAIFYYWLDNAVADSSDIDLNDTTLIIVLTDSVPRNGKGVIVINAFTSEEEYLDFGEEIGLPFDSSDMIIEHLIQVAIDSGWYNSGTTDTIPKGFYDYAQSYIGSLDKAFNGTQIYKNACGSSGSSMIITGYNPKLFFGYDDNVEKFMNGPTGLLIHQKVYARQWFKTKIFDRWITHGTIVCFSGPLAPLADRASSWASILW